SNPSIEYNNTVAPLFHLLENLMIRIEGGKFFFSYPRFNCRPSPACMDHPDRHLEFFVERLREKITGCTEQSCVLRSACRPLSIARRLRLNSIRPFHLKESYVRILCIRNLTIGIGNWVRGAPPFKRHFHIRLSGTKPHFTEQDIVQSNCRIAVRHRYVIRSPRFYRL